MKKHAASERMPRKEQLPGGLTSPESVSAGCVSGKCRLERAIFSSSPRVIINPRGPKGAKNSGPSETVPVNHGDVGSGFESSARLPGPSSAFEDCVRFFHEHFLRDPAE